MTLRIEAELDISQLWDVFLDMQGALWEMTQARPVSYETLISKVLYEAVNYAVLVAPYMTGTLASSHRGEVYYRDDWLVGEIYLDPSVVNPLNYAKPVEYGQVVHQSQPWLDWTMQWLEEEVLDGLETDLADHVVHMLAGAV